MTQREEFAEKYSHQAGIPVESVKFDAYGTPYVDTPYVTNVIPNAMVQAAYWGWKAAKAQAVPDASTSISNPMPSGYMLNTLIKFQKWRIGEDERTLDETGLTPRSITEAIDWAIEQLDKSVVKSVPEGWKLVPIDPTVEQFGGVARDIVQWLRFTESKNQHSESLVKWLKDMGNDVPDWLYSEPEVNHLSKHVLSKGTIAAIIYKAMLAAAPVKDGGE